MTQQTIYIGGSETVTVPATESIAVSNFGGGVAKIYYWIVAANVPDDWQYQQSIENEEVVLGPFSVAQLVRIDSGTSKVLFDIGASPATGTPASTLGGLTAAQFVRSDASDDLTGTDYNLDNQTFINGRDTGATERDLIGVDGSDIAQVGSSALPTNINSDGTLTHNGTAVIDADDIPLPTASDSLKNLQVNAAGDGYNLIGPLYAFKNKLINPWFNYWQRGGELGGTAINVTANDTYTADRMVLIFDGTADVDVEQVALGTPIKIGNRWTVNGLKVTVNTNSGNTYLRLCQRIEYVTSLVDHAAVLNSFVQGSGNLTVPVYARQDFGTGGSSDVVTGFSSDLSVTSSMQELQSGVVIPDVSGKTIVDTDSFLSIEYDLINLVSTDYIIIPFHQFELGENNSFPEYREKPIEDSLIERFYVRFFNLDSTTLVGTGYAISTIAARGLVNLIPSVPMRLESPTGGYTGTTWQVLRINTGYAATSLTFNVKAYGRSNVWTAGVAAGLVADAGVILRADSGSTTSLYIDAELYQ